MRFKDKIAIVTSGGSGMGKETVARFVAEGGSVVINGRNAAKAEAAAREIDPTGTRVFVHAGDVSVPATGEALVKTALQRFGSVTIDYQKRIAIFNYRERPTLQTSPLQLSLLGLSGRYSSSLNRGNGQIQLVSVRVNPDRTMVGNVVLIPGPQYICRYYGQFIGHFYDSAIVVSMPAVQDAPSCPVGSGARVGRIDVTLRLSENGWVGTYQSQAPDAGAIEMAR